MCVFLEFSEEISEMVSQSSKCYEGTPPSGTLAVFMLKTFVPTCKFLAKWAKWTKSSLELQWPLWGTFYPSKLAFLKTKLGDSGSKIKKMNGMSILNAFQVHMT